MNKNLLAAAFCVAALCGGVQAAERLWTGGGDGFRWSDAKNWSPQGVPGAGDDIKIEIDATLYSGNKGVPLLSCSALEGRFAPEKITIHAEHPALYGLRQTDNGLYLTCSKGMVITFR